MATVTGTPKSSSATGEPLPEPERIVLHDVPWDAYLAINSERANRHVRMTYLDGTLELMSPKYRHDKFAYRFDNLIQAVVEVFKIPMANTRTTTIRRKGRGKKKGAGRESDTSFYFANAHLVRHKDEIDLRVDPPPDLAIEVDNTADSKWKLPAYARLGVSEVWRLDVNAVTLWFGQLQADGTYARIERSTALPMLTPAWVYDVMERCRVIGDDMEWGSQVRDWVRAELVPPPAETDF